MVDTEFRAMATILNTLNRLDLSARRRVMHYVFDRVEPLRAVRANGEAEDAEPEVEH